MYDKYQIAKDKMWFITGVNTSKMPRGLPYKIKKTYLNMWHTIHSRTDGMRLEHDPNAFAMFKNKMGPLKESIKRKVLAELELMTMTDIDSYIQQLPSKKRNLYINGLKNINEDRYSKFVLEGFIKGDELLYDDADNIRGRMIYAP